MSLYRLIARSASSATFVVAAAILAGCDLFSPALVVEVECVQCAGNFSIDNEEVASFQGGPAHFEMPAVPGSFYEGMVISAGPSVMTVTVVSYRGTELMRAGPANITGFAFHLP